MDKAKVMSDVAEATRLLVKAGFAVKRGAWDVPSLHANVKLADAGDWLNCTVDWFIIHHNGTWWARVNWPGQVGTSGRFATPVAAAEWLLAMFPILAIPGPNPAIDYDKRLGEVEKLLWAADFLVNKRKRGGSSIVTYLLTKPVDAGDEPRFAVFIDPSGGYYIAKDWPGNVSAEIVRDSPEAVVKWILSWRPRARHATSREAPRPKGRPKGARVKHAALKAAKGDPDDD